MSGDFALALLTGGAALIAFECNRPGRTVPGAAGVMLVLLAGHRLAGDVMGDPLPVFLAAAGVACIVSPWMLRRSNFPGVLGTSLLSVAFGRMALRSHDISLAFAVLVALTLGGSGSWLAQVAGDARRAKRPAKRTCLSTATSSAYERWGVD